MSLQRQVPNLTDKLVSRTNKNFQQNNKQDFQHLANNSRDKNIDRNARQIKNQPKTHSPMFPSVIFLMTNLIMINSKS